VYKRQVQELDIELHEDEFDYWRKQGGAAKKR